MTAPDTRPTRPTGFRALLAEVSEWLPLALLSFGVLGVVRWYSLVALEGELGSPAALAEWNAAGGFAQALVHVVVSAFAGTAVLVKTRGRSVSRPLVLLVAAGLFASGATGWPLAPAVFMPKLGAELGLANFGVVAALGAVWTFVIEVLARVPALSQPLAVVPAAVVGFAPLGIGFVAVETPTMVTRVPVLQLMNEMERVTFESIHPVAKRLIAGENATAAPSQERMREFLGTKWRRTITPAVYKEYDAGDKDTLISPPGTEFSFDVPGDELVHLRTSVAADVSAFDKCYKEGGSYAVLFELLVNRQLVGSATVAISGELPAEERIWRHFGDEAGVALKPGDHVTFRSSFAPGSETTEDPGKTWCGWSDLLLERRETVERLHSSPDFPNVVLIVMDTLRADRMSCYGYERETTPNLDALARAGLRYERAYSTSSWTWPSTASILTGHYPQEHGVVSNEACTLALDQMSIAEALQRRGYTTMGFSCNPLIHPDRYYDQGFEGFDPCLDKKFRMSDEVTPQIKEWVRDHHGSRFFLYLHLADPHTPHRPHEEDLERFAGKPPEEPPLPRIIDDPKAKKQHEPWDVMDHYNGVLGTAMKLKQQRQIPFDPDELVPAAHQQWMNDVYDASVATGDRYVGEILDTFRELGLDERTLFIFTADHGEEYMEHGRLGHGHTLFEEVVHVPLILAGPGIPAGVVADTPVSNRHVAPTIAAYANTKFARVEEAKNLCQPNGVASEDIHVQTVKGLVDGRARYILEGLIQDDTVWHYARRCNAQGDIFYEADDKGHQVPSEEVLYRFELLTDPGQDRPTVEDPRGSPVVEQILRHLLAQQQRKKGVTRGTGAGGDEMLIGVGYIETRGDD